MKPLDLSRNVFFLSEAVISCLNGSVMYPPLLVQHGRDPFSRKGTSACVNGLLRLQSTRPSQITSEIAAATAHSPHGLRASAYRPRLLPNSPVRTAASQSCAFLLGLIRRKESESS